MISAHHQAPAAPSTWKLSDPSNKPHAGCDYPACDISVTASLNGSVANAQFWIPSEFHLHGEQILIPLGAGYRIL
jgi:hypothetical protein